MRSLNSPKENTGFIQFFPILPHLQLASLEIGCLWVKCPSLNQSATAGVTRLLRHQHVQNGQEHSKEEWDQACCFLLKRPWVGQERTPRTRLNNPNSWSVKPVPLYVTSPESQCSSYVKKAQIYAESQYQSLYIPPVIWSSQAAVLSRLYRQDFLALGSDPRGFLRSRLPFLSCQMCGRIIWICTR